MSDFCDHCGDEFHFDDTGGYNPPCRCGLNCRSCCEHACVRDEPTDFDEYPDDNIPAAVREEGPQ